MGGVSGGGGSSNWWGYDVHGSWLAAKPERIEPCDTFHPYTTTQLCKACGGPAQVHKSFMARHTEKQRLEAEEAKERERNQLLDELAHVVDMDEIIDIGSMKLPRWQIEKFKVLAEEAKLVPDRDWGSDPVFHGKGK